MDNLSDKRALVEAVAETAGLTALALEADVPLTTLSSLKKRDWENKSVDMFDRLVAAARRIQDAQGAA